MFSFFNFPQDDKEVIGRTISIGGSFDLFYFSDLSVMLMGVLNPYVCAPHAKFQNLGTTPSGRKVCDLGEKIKIILKIVTLPSAATPKGSACTLLRPTFPQLLRSHIQSFRILRKLGNLKINIGAAAFLISQSAMPRYCTPEQRSTLLEPK